MALNPNDLYSDEGNFDRRVPKRAQKSFDTRRAPSAARPPVPDNKNVNGIHRRRRRQYGL